MDPGSLYRAPARARDRQDLSESRCATPRLARARLAAPLFLVVAVLDVDARGARNVRGRLLLAVVATVATLDPSKTFPGTDIGIPTYLREGVLLVLVGLMILQALLEWARVLSGRKVAVVREAPFVASQFAPEEA